MTRGLERLVWVLAVLLLAGAGARLVVRPDPYRAGAPLGAVEDRRLHRFRDLSWSQTERLASSVLLAAERAPDRLTRARLLAQFASLQRERGFEAASRAAAAEALRLGGHDAETQRLLASPFEVKPR